MTRNESATKPPLRFKPSVIEIVLLALCVYLSVAVDRFLTWTNLLNILRGVSMPGIIAFGMTMVIVAGEIDLSVGSAVAFAGCLMAWVTAALMDSRFHVAVIPALLLGTGVSLMAGTAVGVLTGILRAKFRVPTFISTLAWMTVLRGGAELITGGFPIKPFPDWFNFLGGGFLCGIPFPIYVFALVFAVCQIVMSKTAFGRAVYAVGGNAEAARLSGLKVGLVKTQVMVIVGCLAVVSGIMQASQIMSGSAATAQGWELDVISSVIIGGTSLMGGSGTIRGTLVGVLFLGVLVNSMTLTNTSEYWQNVVRGALILLAVLINMAPSSRQNALKS